MPRLNNNYNYVIVAKKDATTATYSEIKFEIEKLLKKAKAINEISDSSVN